MDCLEVHFSGHAVMRLFERGLSKDQVLTIIRTGERIADYPDDSPYPSCLLLGYIENKPVHVVIARDAVTGICFVATTYQPDPQLWSANFKLRRVK